MAVANKTPRWMSMEATGAENEARDIPDETPDFREAGARAPQPKAPLSTIRRLLPWFLWAQLLPAFFCRGAMPTVAFTVLILVLAALGVARGWQEAAGLLGAPAPQGRWLRSAGLLLFPLLVWPRLVSVPFQFAWPDLPVSQPGAGVAALLTAALLGPLAEELLYRGVLINALRPFGKFAALAVSSVLFGMGHGPVLFLTTALVGWVLGWVAWEHRSIWPAFGLHVAFNLASVVGVVSLPAAPEESSMIIQVLVLGVFFFVAVAVTVRHRGLIARVLTDSWPQRHVAGLRRPVLQAMRLWPVAGMMVIAALGWLLLILSPRLL